MKAKLLDRNGNLVAEIDVTMTAVTTIVRGAIAYAIDKTAPGTYRQIPGAAFVAP